MTDSLFNAELRDCARVNEIAEQREVSRDEQAYHNACDQGHDWDDYDDPVDLWRGVGFPRRAGVGLASPSPSFR